MPLFRPGSLRTSGAVLRLRLRLRLAGIRPIATVPSPATPHPLFRSQELQKGVFLIEENFFDSWNKANIFYVIGSKRDLLVDTGTGLFSLSRYLAYSGIRPDEEKPLSVVLTHCHFDHSGGAHQFQGRQIELALHRSEAPYIASKTRNSKLMTAAWIMPYEVTPKPESTDDADADAGSQGWKARDYHVKPARVTRHVDEGDRIELGDWTFKILHLPGHSPGSLGLYDSAAGLLVSGDTLYQTDGELIDWYPGSSVGRMFQSVTRLRDLATAGDLQLVLPGHNPVMRGGLSIAKMAEAHLAQSVSRRKMAKMWSRLRARLLLGANALDVATIPDIAREWLKH